MFFVLRFGIWVNWISGVVEFWSCVYWVLQDGFYWIEAIGYSMFSFVDVRTIGPYVISFYFILLEFRVPTVVLFPLNF